MDELRRLAIEAALGTLTSQDREDAGNLELARELLSEAGLTAWAENPPSPEAAKPAAPVSN